MEWSPQRVRLGNRMALLAEMRRIRHVKAESSYTGSRQLCTLCRPPGGMRKALVSGTEVRAGYKVQSEQHPESA